MSDETTGRPEPETGGADQPIDELDEAALLGLAAILEAVDGPPAGFTERMRFAIAARGLDDELARLTEDEPATARGSTRSARTWTFEAPSLTILLNAEPIGSGVRVDGWLSPAATRTIRLSRPDASQRETTSDEAGRFTYGSLPAGLVQMIVAATANLPAVVTPTFEL